MSSELERVNALVQVFREQNARVDELEKALKAAKEAARRIETEDLPELMREVCPGINLVRLDDGDTVELTEDIQCGISEERKARAHAWLIENGFGGLIKTSVSAAFGKEERDKAVDAADKLSKIIDAPVELDESVHSGTLKSFLKEQLEAGKKIPFDLFGIFVFNRVKVKEPKRK